MKLVRESIEFTRGQDPKSAMNIGAPRGMSNQLAELSNDYRIKDLWIDRWQGKKCLSVGYDINYGWNPSHEAVKEHLGLEWFNLKLGYHSNLSGVRNYFIKPEYEYLFNRVGNGKIYDISNESVEFKRGQDPKIAMGVGRARIRKAVEKEIIQRTTISLDKWVWDFEYMKIRGYDAYLIEIDLTKGNQDYIKEYNLYFVVVPGLYANEMPHRDKGDAIRIAKDYLSDTDIF